MDLEGAIRESYLAKGLTDDQVNSLVSIAEWRTFDGGAEILRQFDQSRDLMILASGLADIITVVGEPIGLVKPGMPIGEVSFLDGKPRSGTVVATSPCSIVLLAWEPLMEMLSASPEMWTRILLNISQVLCGRLRGANQHLAALMAIEELGQP